MTFVLPIVDGRRRWERDSPWTVVAEAPAARQVGFVPPPVTDVIFVVPAREARVNHNRWIADCPDCGGAEFIWRDGPLVMLCLSCLNAGVGHMWRPVALPPDVEAGEAALLARPFPATRNWDAGEAVADLLRDNAAHLEGG